MFVDQKKINELVEETRAYLEARIQLSKLQFIEISSDQFSKVMAGFIIGGVALIFMISFSFFAGIALSELLNNQTAGFGIVAAFYFLLLVCLVIYRKKLLKQPIQDATIKSIFENEDKDED